MPQLEMKRPVLIVILRRAFVGSRDGFFQDAFADPFPQICLKSNVDFYA